MTEHISAPVRLILMVLAFVLFLIATVWPAPPEPHYRRLVAAGLACWALSTFF